MEEGKNPMPIVDENLPAVKPLDKNKGNLSPRKSDITPRYMNWYR